VKLSLEQKLFEARQVEKDLRGAFFEKEIIGKKFEMSFQSKAVSIDEKNHTAEFVMSSPEIDRHGDIIDQDSWILDYFVKNPGFYWQHNSDDFPLGSWEDVRLEAYPPSPDKKQLVGRARFDIDIEPTADRAWKHILKGNIRMVSVGFIPHRIEYDETRDAFILYDCELLECSLVGIGSNRQALMKETEVDPKDKARASAIEAKNAIDAQIKKDNNNTVIAHLKVREDLNRVIRKLSI
jgi:HK97 family phage prohead protease